MLDASPGHLVVLDRSHLSFLRGGKYSNVQHGFKVLEKGVPVMVLEPEIYAYERVVRCLTRLGVRFVDIYGIGE